MKHEARFPAETGSVVRARRWIAQRIGNAPREMVELIGLVVTELAANAVRHAKTDFAVAIERNSGAIRLEVQDTGAGVPTLRKPGLLDSRGRGLQIVDTLADQWGVSTLRPSGKTVWAIFQVSSAGTVPDERPSADQPEQRSGDREESGPNSGTRSFSPCSPRAAA